MTGLGAISPRSAPTSTRRGTALLRGRVRDPAWEDLAAEGFPRARWPPGSSTTGWGDPLTRRRGTVRGPPRRPRGARGRRLLARPARTSTRTRLGVFVGTTMGESAVFETAADRGDFDLAAGGGQAFAAAVG